MAFAASCHPRKSTYPFHPYREVQQEQLDGFPWNEYLPSVNFCVENPFSSYTSCNRGYSPQPFGFKQKIRQHSPPATSSDEPNLSLSNCKALTSCFPGFIGIDDRETAYETAKEEERIPFDPNRFVIWADGSYQPDHPTASSCAIVWKQPQHQECYSWQSNPSYLQPWGSSIWYLTRAPDNNAAELGGLELGLQKGLEHFQTRGPFLAKINRAREASVVVYTDNQCALNCMEKRYRSVDEAKKKLKYGGPFMVEARARAMEAAYDLDRLGVSVELRWTPGHAGVEGNTRADGLAWGASKTQVYMMQSAEWKQQMWRRQVRKGVYLSL